MVAGDLLMVLVVAVIAYATRAAGLVFGQRSKARPDEEKRRASMSWDRFLAYVPVAIFAALVVPDLGVGTGDVLPRLAGATLAAVVVIRFGHLWTGLASGMAAYWMTGALATLLAA